MLSVRKAMNSFPYDDGNEDVQVVTAEGEAENENEGGTEVKTFEDYKVSN